MTKIRFALNPVQIPLMKLVREQKKKIGKIRLIVFKCRQPGISTWSAGLVAQKYLLNDNVYAFTIAQDKTTVANIFKMHDIFYTGMDDDIRPVELYHTKGTERVVGDISTQSRLLVGEAKNINVGTGQTIHVCHASEVCRYPYPQQITDSLIPALSDAPGTIRIFESTAFQAPGGVWFKSMCERAIRGENEYAFHFVQWWKMPEYQLPLAKGEKLKLSEEEKTLVKRHGLSVENIKWRRMKIGDLDGDVETFRQSYPITFEEGWQIKGSTAFSRERLMEMREMIRPPIETYSVFENSMVKDPEGEFKVWIKPEPGKTYDIGCLPDGEKILTPTGWKNIEAIAAGESVLDKDGEEVSVTAVMRRQFAGELCELYPAGMSRPLRLTGEHPVWLLSARRSRDVRRPDWRKGRHLAWSPQAEWKNAENVIAGDTVSIPIPFQDEIGEQEVLSYWPDDTKVRIDRWIGKQVLLDQDFWWLMGLYCADGYAWIATVSPTQKNCAIEFALNFLKDGPIADRASGVIKRLFNRKATQSIAANCLKVRFSSELVYQFIIENFGCGALTKRVGHWVKSLPKHLRIALFAGYYDGDGSTFPVDNDPVVACVSCSEDLVNDFQDVLLSCQIFCTVGKLRDAGPRIIKGKKVWVKAAYQLKLTGRPAKRFLDGIGVEANLPEKKRLNSFHWFDQGRLYIKIRKVGRVHFEGVVNNLETNSHSYYARHIGVHNCDVGGGSDIGDASTIEVVERYSLTQVAEWRGFIDPVDFAYVIATIGRWYNDAQVAPEVEKFGMGTLVKLQQLYTNIYIWRKRDTIVPEFTHQFGWSTSHTSKLMITAFARHSIWHRKVQIFSLELWQELMNYSHDVTPSGMHTYNAAPGETDDLVMGWMIAIQTSDDENILKWTEQKIETQQGKKAVMLEEAFHAPALRSITVREYQEEVGDWK